MGEMEVPATALYGASTQRAVLNFPVSGRPLPFEVIRAFGVLKRACAEVNRDLGLLDKQRASAIIKACKAVEAGLADHGGWQRHFPVDIYQTGSGTSTNMNANEVIANLICLDKGKPIGSSKDPAYLKAGGVHPNGHVNMGQSSNDTFPTAMHVAAAAAICEKLLPALDRLASALEAKAQAWDKIVKIGRTHLQDATPIRLGQEFSGFAAQLRHGEARLKRALDTLSELALGGTAVGTGINTHKQFGKLVAQKLTEAYGYPPTLGYPPTPWGATTSTTSPSSTTPSKSNYVGPKFREARNHFEAQHAKDAVVETSGHLRTIAISLSKIASDIRLMGCGPRCGIGELKLPAVQPGSSIMPGKVNPVICESMMMVTCQVIGSDAAIATAGLGGIGGLLDLHVAMPVMAANLIEQINLLAGACDMFGANLVEGLEPDEQRCAELIEGSLAMCTSLAPVIGYDAAAALAKKAFAEGKTVRELALEDKILPESQLNKLLNPMAMTKPAS
ncbi:MAG: class II fumarate hydratase [Phycisphaerales bacterium JB039]